MRIYLRKVSYDKRTFTPRISHEDCRCHYRTRHRLYRQTFSASAAPIIHPDDAPATSPGDADAWFSTIKGKHRIVFDVTAPHQIFPFAWPKVFLLTNASTGTPEKENSVVVILRHEGIPFAFEDRLWAKYKFGE